MSTSLERLKEKVVAFFKESGEVKETDKKQENNPLVTATPTIIASKTPTVPRSKSDLVKLLRRCSPDVLSDQERNIIAATMMFDQRPVKDIMLQKKDMTFVHDMDFLGPLTLDKLYQSGYEDFPVLGPNGQIVGVLNTHSFNNLSIKETDRVVKYLTHDLSYIREDHTLAMALAAFLRTNSKIFLVINKYRQVVGMLTLRDVLEHLLGGAVLEDDFEADHDIETVAKRPRQ